MKAVAVNIYWKEETFTQSQNTPDGKKIGGGYETKHGATVVVAANIMYALDHFEKKFPNRVINSANIESDEVLVMGDPA